MVRLPESYRVLAALGLRLLRPRSRLRRGALRRQLSSGHAAFSRRDLELALVRYARDVEVEFEPDLEALGIAGRYQGHDGILRLIETFGEAWEQWEIHPAAMLDMGDRFLALGHVFLRGGTSGIELEREFAQLITVRRGLIAYEREFLSWSKGLRAAGIDPDSLALQHGRPSRAASTRG